MYAHQGKAGGGGRAEAHRSRPRLIGLRVYTTSAGMQQMRKHKIGAPRRIVKAGLPDVFGGNVWFPLACLYKVISRHPYTMVLSLLSNPAAVFFAHGAVAHLALRKPSSPNRLSVDIGNLCSCARQLLVDDGIGAVDV